VDWFESVPQVQLWLSLRATRSHGFTPFSIMFSRPFVGFKDFSKVPLDELSPEMLQKRYNAAFDFCYPAVDSAAKKIVNSRKLKFDKKWNCTVELFPDGSYVMLRSPGRLSKQHPKYVGPYIVLRCTRGGSYVLQDETGDLFPRNASPSQLKLISYENTRNAITAGESVRSSASSIIVVLLEQGSTRCDGRGMALTKTHGKMHRTFRLCLYINTGIQ
jgi:hypothetical protein